LKETVEGRKKLIQEAMRAAEECSRCLTAFLNSTKVMLTDTAALALLYRNPDASQKALKDSLEKANSVLQVFTTATADVPIVNAFSGLVNVLRSVVEELLKRRTESAAAARLREQYKGREGQLFEDATQDPLAIAQMLGDQIRRRQKLVLEA